MTRQSRFGANKADKRRYADYNAFVKKGFPYSGRLCTDDQRSLPSALTISGLPSETYVRTSKAWA